MQNNEEIYIKKLKKEKKRKENYLTPLKNILLFTIFKSN